MASAVQIHHFLPVEVFGQFTGKIDTWTDGTFQIDANYNLVPLATSIDQAAWGIRGETDEDADRVYFDVLDRFFAIEREGR